jgi:uncharacterized protein
MIVSDGSFRSTDTDCAYRIWKPCNPSGRTHPCVVMANGFSLTIEDGLPAFAQRFAAGGFVVVAFDFRHLGASGGGPRQVVDYARQRADFAAAVSFARQLDEVNPSAVAVWGLSVSAGHAIQMAAEDAGIAAVVGLSPMLDAVAFALRSSRNTARIMFDGTREALTGRAVRVPAVGPVGSYAVLAGGEAMAGMAAIRGDTSLWRNEASPRPLLKSAMFRPFRSARRVRCPLLICLGDRDTIAPRRAARFTARHAARGELRRYPIDHFGGFIGRDFDRVATDQLEFLARHMCRQEPARSRS